MTLATCPVNAHSSFSVVLVEDFSDTDIKLGDYIRLKGLKIGDLIYVKKGEEIKVLLIGNATPFEGVSADSHDGWDWEKYNQYIVLKVFRVELEQNGYWIAPV